MTEVKTKTTKKPAAKKPAAKTEAPKPEPKAGPKVVATDRPAPTKDGIDIDSIIMWGLLGAVATIVVVAFFSIL